MSSINATAAALQNQLAMQGGLGGYPIEAGMAPGSLAALNGGGSKPQVNATNQSALAPNGDINQTVTNSNTYENKYYNVSTVTQPYYGVGGGAFLNGSNGWGNPMDSNSYVDPRTGVLYVRQETGIIGWFKRLLRGY